MIDFQRDDAEVGYLRATTQQELAAEHLPDDNNLLSYLQVAGYLVDKTLTGYLPAALFSYHGEPDGVEILVDGPIGERGLTMNGGPRFTYEFPHRRLSNLFGSPGKTLSTDTGHVIETQTGDRYFLPKGAASVKLKVSRGRMPAGAVSTECERLGLIGMASSSDYISHEYGQIQDLSFTRAIREAAKWAAYTLKKPWDNERDDDYPRTLTVDEAQVCLRTSFHDIKQETPKWDITVIKEVIQG